MSNENDSTPLTEDLADIAANEGVASAGSVPKKKPGRKPKYPPGHPKSRAGEKRNGGGGARKKPAGGSPQPPPPEMPEMPDGMEPPFSAKELRDVMTQVGSALFSLPGEAMAARVLKRHPDRPDWAAAFLLPPEQAAMGGKAVVWYVNVRFPEIFAKWGPEVMLLGAALVFYGPRAVMMNKEPPPVADEKPSTVHAKAA